MIKLENMGTYFELGSPCKIGGPDEFVYGRYVGNVDNSGTMDIGNNKQIHSLIIFATPGGSIIKSGRCYILFDMTPEDLQELKKFEAFKNTDNNEEWYHKLRTPEELNTLGKCMPYQDIKPL